MKKYRKNTLNQKGSRRKQGGTKRKKNKYQRRNRTSNTRYSGGKIATGGSSRASKKKPKQKQKPKQIPPSDPVMEVAESFDPTSLEGIEQSLARAGISPSSLPYKKFEIGLMEGLDPVEPTSLKGIEQSFARAGISPDSLAGQKLQVKLLEAQIQSLENEKLALTGPKNKPARQLNREREREKERAISNIVSQSPSHSRFFSTTPYSKDVTFLLLGEIHHDMTCSMMNFDKMNRSLEDSMFENEISSPDDVLQVSEGNAYNSCYETAAMMAQDSGQAEQHLRGNSIIEEDGTHDKNIKTISIIINILEILDNPCGVAGDEDVADIVKGMLEDVSDFPVDFQEDLTYLGLHAFDQRTTFQRQFFNRRGRIIDKLLLLDLESYPELIITLHDYVSNKNNMDMLYGTIVSIKRNLNELLMWIRDNNLFEKINLKLQEKSNVTMVVLIMGLAHIPNCTALIKRNGFKLHRNSMSVQQAALFAAAPGVPSRSLTSQAQAHVGTTTLRPSAQPFSSLELSQILAHEAAVSMDV
jgi:hypothetical protein